MSILPLSWAARASEPFCDYLNVSVPRALSESLETALGDFTATWGIHPEPGLDGYYRLGLGTIAIKPRGKVLIVSASGHALYQLRAMGAYAEYLHVLASFPHRVSMLHATCDYYASSPSAVVQHVKRIAYAEAVHLTRKRIQAKHVKHVFCVNAQGDETGTVYMGQRANADVWAKVYDKHQEQFSKGNTRAPMTVRVEIAIQSDMGATLRDAYTPASAFFHFAGRSFVEVPAGATPWVGLGEGFLLPESEAPLLTVYQQIERIIDDAPELKRLRKLAASEWGDRAWEHVGRLIMRGATITS